MVTILPLPALIEDSRSGGDFMLTEYYFVSLFIRTNFIFNFF